MKRLLVLVLLVGCSTTAAPPPKPALVIPRELTFCPKGVPQPATPKPPRTTEVIADAFNKAKTAGQTTDAALAECSRRLDRLNKLISP